MKQWLPLCLALALSACSSTSELTYYQLPTPAQPVLQSASQAGAPQLWIDQVRIPDYLAENGLVYQTTDVQYSIATQNLWASPLDQQLRSTLAANLSARLPGWIVSSQPLGNEQSVLSVEVTDFYGRYDGHVIVSGEWLLNQQGTLIKRPFYIDLKQQQDGYDAMVKVLAQGWQQAATQIAAQLERLP